MITALQISAVDDPATDATVLEKFIGLSIKSNRGIAMHGNATTDMLRCLAQSPDQLTRRNVAASGRTAHDRRKEKTRGRN